jgi:hypothetical protein
MGLFPLLQARQYAAQHVPKPRVRAKVDYDPSADSHANAVDEDQEPKPQPTRAARAKSLPPQRSRSSSSASHAYAPDPELDESTPAPAPRASGPSAVQHRPFVTAKFDPVPDILSPPAVGGGRRGTGQLDDARFYEPSDEWNLRSANETAPSPSAAAVPARKPVGQRPPAAVQTQVHVRPVVVHAPVPDAPMDPPGEVASRRSRAPASEFGAPTSVPVHASGGGKAQSASTPKRERGPAAAAGGTPAGVAAVRGGKGAKDSKSQDKDKKVALADSSDGADERPAALSDLLMDHESKRDMVADFRRQFGF